MTTTVVKEQKELKNNYENLKVMSDKKLEELKQIKLEHEEQVNMYSNDILKKEEEFRETEKVISKNKDIYKTYRSLEEKIKNEFKYDHVYNHKNIKNKVKLKDLKVSRKENFDCVGQSSSDKYTKNHFKSKNINKSQSLKIKISFKDLSLGPSIVDHTTSVTDRDISGNKLHARESICTVYKYNITSIIKTSVVLNKNRKGKSDVSFEIEVSLSLKSTNFRDDLFSNPGEVRDNAQIERIKLGKEEFSTADIEDICDECNFNLHERTFHLQDKMFLTNKTPKVSNIKCDKSYYEIKTIISNEDRNICSKLAKENSLSFFNQNLSLNVDINKNFQSPPDSLHFGLIHKLTQTSDNQGHTKLVIKKVGYKAIDKMKCQNSPSSVLKRYVATKIDLFSFHLLVKNDSNSGKGIPYTIKEKILKNNEDENCIEWIKLINKPSKSKLSKSNADLDNGEEAFEIISKIEQPERKSKELFNKLRKDNKNTVFEQKSSSSKDSSNSNPFSLMNGAFTSTNKNNNGDSDSNYFDLEKDLPTVHAFVSIHEDFKSRKNYFDSFFSNLAEHDNNTSGHNPLEICFCLERSNILYALEGTRISKLLQP